MGFSMNWDVNNIKNQLRRMYSECGSSYNDGFTSWIIKQELYEVKFLVDELLSKCVKFGPEEEWLKLKEQEKIIEILKK
jgi:hypothetical protein